MIFINDNKYSWFSTKTESYQLMITGLCCYENRLLTYQEVSHILAGFLKKNQGNELVEIEKELTTKFSGHFSIVIEAKGYVIALVDKIRSFPIYYSFQNNRLVISNSSIKIKQECRLNSKNENAWLEFKMAGYIIGRDTLYQNLFQIQAGECLLYNRKTHKLKLKRYYRYWDDETVEKNEVELGYELDTILKNTFSDLVNSLNGSPVYVPLSGGLDSRLILAMLKEMKYDNVFSYTYGVKGLWEIERAEYIAKLLNVKWSYVQLKPNETKKFFNSRDRRNYFDYAAGLNTVPQIPEYYGLLRLREENLIDDNGIIINGQTGDFITGGHIPNLIREDGLNTDKLVNALMDKHFSLWRNLKTPENISIVSKRILEQLNLPQEKGLSREEFAKYYELYEWEARQSKYVVNGQRIYEWLGYDWRLPFWSDELMNFWRKVGWQMKLGQAFYKKFLIERNYAGVFDLSPPENKSYMPYFVKFFRKSMGGLGFILSKDFIVFVNKYTRYFMNYAPFYHHSSYLQYLKDARWHRNPISYFVNCYLSELNVEQENNVT